MIPVDQLLISSSLQISQSNIEKRDKRIFNSFIKQLHSNVFLTENQSILLIKLLTKHHKILKINFDQTNIVWSKPFRVINDVRTIKIDNDKFIVQFTPNKKLSRKLTKLNNKISNTYVFDLTEQNIYNVLSLLEQDKFEIDTELLTYYIKIKEIINSNFNPFSYENLPSTLEEIILKETQNDELLLSDRQLKYQYSYSYNNESSVDLATKLATRKKRKVFVNNSIPIETVFNSLNRLKRYPILLIFDPYSSENCINHLNLVLPFLKNKKSSIFFRFDNNTNSNKEFNDIVNLNMLNRPLDLQSEIVGISSKHLPKFMMKTDWKPCAVISFTNNFNFSKISVYCNNVDLIIYYNTHPPINGSIDELV